jgi:hypothetical protein
MLQSIWHFKIWLFIHVSHLFVVNDFPHEEVQFSSQPCLIPKGWFYPIEAATSQVQSLLSPARVAAIQSFRKAIWVRD